MYIMIIIFFLASSGEKDTNAEKAKQLLIILREKQSTSPWLVYRKQLMIAL